MDIYGGREESSSVVYAKSLPEISIPLRIELRRGFRGSGARFAERIFVLSAPKIRERRTIQSAAGAITGSSGKDIIHYFSLDNV